MTPTQTPRSEAEIFEDLAKLCIEPGFAHAIAFFCFRDNSIRMASALTAQDVLVSYSPERLIRTEISTLIGLMLKSPLDLRLPEPMLLESSINRAEALLQEIHTALNLLMLSKFTPDEIAAGHNPFANASALREPIFYGGESAYDFQYHDLAPTKYRNDADWLLANKGFTIEQASSVFRAVESVQSDKLNSHLQSLRQLHPDARTTLPAFTFSLEEISRCCSLEDHRVRTVLEAFTPQAENRNETFNSLTRLIHDEDDFRLADVA